MKHKPYPAEELLRDMLADIAQTAVAGSSELDEVLRACHDGLLSYFKWDGVGPNEAGQQVGLTRFVREDKVLYSTRRWESLYLETVGIACDLWSRREA